MSIIKLHGRKGKYYKKGFNAQDKIKYFYEKNTKFIQKIKKENKQILSCIELDCKNMAACKNLQKCLNNNKLAYKNNKTCYAPENT